MNISIISLSLTKLYVIQSFSIASSVTYSEILQNFSHSGDSFQSSIIQPANIPRIVSCCLYSLKRQYREKEKYVSKDTMLPVAFMQRTSSHLFPVAYSLKRQYRKKNAFLKSPCCPLLLCSEHPRIVSCCL